MNRTTQAEQAILSHGYSVHYVPHIPGPGTILGTTNRLTQQVHVGWSGIMWAAVEDRCSPWDLLPEVVGHELRHVVDPWWDCGSRARMGVA